MLLMDATIVGRNDVTNYISKTSLVRFNFTLQQNYVHILMVKMTMVILRVQQILNSRMNRFHRFQKNHWRNINQSVFLFHVDVVVLKKVEPNINAFLPNVCITNELTAYSIPKWMIFNSLFCDIIKAQCLHP